LSEPNAPRPAVFLDRDGTICEEVGYLNHISRLRVFPFASAAIRRLNDAHVPVIVVSNQAGISRKIIPEDLVQETHRRITEELARHGAHIDGFYYCPHARQDQCSCRKPLPGLLEQAAREHHIAVEKSYVIGDRYVDVELGQRAGGHGVLVLTGYGRGEYELHSEEWPRQPDYVADNLAVAVEMILAERS
jgi:D-glycero-D-manno-heptose 1,7-bisphosphate phosphatase